MHLHGSQRWHIHTIPHTIHHYSDVIMGVMVSQITSLTIVYSTVYPGADQRKHQSSASLALVRGIHRWPVNSTHKWPVTRKMYPFNDIIMMEVCSRRQVKCVVVIRWIVNIRIFTRILYIWPHSFNSRHHFERYGGVYSHLHVGSVVYNINWPTSCFIRRYIVETNN